MTRTASGLFYEDVTVGAGAEARAGNVVRVNYSGWLPNGTLFDANTDPANPLEFLLGAGVVIPGWDEGVAGMRVGGVRKLVIPPSGALPPIPNHYVSQPVTSAGEVPIRADTSMAVDNWNSELLVSSGDNLWRYGDLTRGYLFPDYAKPFTNIAGVGVDEIGNLYLADSFAGTLTVIPNLKRNPSFFQELISDPAVRSLYTLIDGLDSPGDLRLAGDQKALIWFDRVGFHHYAFGFSGRLVDLNDNPIPGARVSVENRGPAAEVITDQFGVFRLRGLRGPGLSDQVSLLIRTRDGESGTYRVNLNRIGHTFHERVVFLSDFLPAGTYQYSYTLQTTIPGRYQVIPATAREAFFPEVFGRSDGFVFEIEP